VSGLVAALDLTAFALTAFGRDESNWESARHARAGWMTASLLLCRRVSFARRLMRVLVLLVGQGLLRLAQLLLHRPLGPLERLLRASREALGLRRRSKAALRSYTLSLRVQLAGTSVTVVELAPPGTETPLFRGEFAEELKNQKGMSVKVLVKRALDGLESNRLEIRPGLSNVLKAMSRLAPDFMLKQLSKMTRLERNPKLLGAATG